jgi:hypothetical protein
MRGHLRPVDRFLIDNQASYKTSAGGPWLSGNRRQLRRAYPSAGSMIADIEPLHVAIALSAP